MADVVEREDVNEAMRLIEMSKASLTDEEGTRRYISKTLIVILIYLSRFSKIMSM